MGVDLSKQVVLRWDSAANCAPLVGSGSIDAVWLQAPDETIAAACRSAGARVLPANAIRLSPLAEAGSVGPGETVATKAGVWPGAQAGARGGGAFVAGATSRAWVDANGYLIAYLRALYPQQAPVLGYLPDRDSGIAEGKVINYDSLELALVEAWSAGGNYVLAPDKAYREALVAGNEAALTAWKRLGRTAAWLKEHPYLFNGPNDGAITVLVEPGDATAEIANLMYRHSASPDLVSAARPPAPDPARRPILVAAGIHSVSAGLSKILLAHAHAGVTVVTDTCDERAWWRVSGIKLLRQFEDREFYSLGSGRVLAYKEPVADPGEFAQDVLDLAAGHRAVRLWEMSAAIATVSRPNARSATLRLVNYGSPARSEVMVHVRGSFSSATAMRPESEPLPLRTYRRGGETEVMLPALTRLAVVEFK